MVGNLRSRTTRHLFTCNDKLCWLFSVAESDIENVDSYDLGKMNDLIDNANCSYIQEPVYAISSIRVTALIYSIGRLEDGTTAQVQKRDD